MVPRPQILRAERTDGLSRPACGSAVLISRGSGGRTRRTPTRASSKSDSSGAASEPANSIEDWDGVVDGVCKPNDTPSGICVADLCLSWAFGLCGSILCSSSSTIASNRPSRSRTFFRRPCNCSGPPSPSCSWLTQGHLRTAHSTQTDPLSDGVQRTFRRLPMAGQTIPCEHHRCGSGPTYIRDSCEFLSSSACEEADRPHSGFRREICWPSL